MLDEVDANGLPRRIAAGLTAAVEGPFSASRRLRLARRLGCNVLTLFGRSDTGLLLASHPGFFLHDAAGIPLPNVDLRPLNPADGSPLSLGREVVERAEIGVKSALAPAGASADNPGVDANRSCRCNRPDGFLYLHPRARLRAV